MKLIFNLNNNRNNRYNTYYYLIKLKFTGAKTVGQKVSVNFFPLSFLNSFKNIRQKNFSISILKCDVITDVRKENVLRRPKRHQPQSEIGSDLWKSLDLQQIPDPAIGNRRSGSDQRREEV